MSEVKGVGSRASRDLIGALEALEDLGLFAPRGSLWSPLEEGASEVWLLHAG